MRDTSLLHQVGTVTELADEWGMNRESLIQTIRRVNGRFEEGVDYKVSGKTVMVTIEAMKEVYGEKENARRLDGGVYSDDFIEEMYKIRSKSRSRKINILNEVLTIQEASEIWDISSGAISQSISKKDSDFIKGMDWRRTSNVIFITRGSLERFYGHPRNKRDIVVGLTEESFEERLGVKKVGHNEMIFLGSKFDCKRSMPRVIYKHPKHGRIARVQNVWFKLSDENVVLDYIDRDVKLYNYGYPEQDDIQSLHDKFRML